MPDGLSEWRTFHLAVAMIEGNGLVLVVQRGEVMNSNPRMLPLNLRSEGVLTTWKPDPRLFFDPRLLFVVGDARR